MSVDLSGSWLAHESGPELAKTFAEVGADDGTWANVRVPHHWREEPAFAASDGPVLYRRHFETRSRPGHRAFLELDGIFYYGDVWLDGEYLGATEGWFASHSFEVTDALAAREQHVLAIEVACPPQRDRGAKRMLTGILDEHRNRGGIWQPIRIVESGAARITRLRVLCVEASVEVGRLAFDLTIDAGDKPHDGQLRAVGRGPGGAMLFEATRDATLAAGTNELEWTVAVDDPPRWWPRALGPQSVCTVDLTVDIDGDVSDERTRRVAFREVKRDDNQFFINGERLFLKGASYGPTEHDDVQGDIELALAADLDFLRVYAHVASPSFYDAADEAGLLVWQDFPMHGGYARGVRKQAVRQARAMVDLLAHHPSIFLWCAHTAPTVSDELVNRAVARAIRKADPTRPTSRTDGVNLWFGTRRGTLAGLAPAIRAAPVLGRFVSAFGASAGDDVDSQAYQAALLQLQIEDLRRCKSTPAGGFAMYTLIDTEPGGGFGVLDDARTPKRGYAALRDACRPVLAMIDSRTGAVHAVNDTRVALEDVQIDVTVDGRTRSWMGDLGADTLLFVGWVELRDAIDVEAVLTHASVGQVVNRYPLVLLEAGRT